MRYTVKLKISVLVSVLAIFCFSAIVPAEGSFSVSFEDGNIVKLGYATDTPLMWETKILPDTREKGDRTLFLGSSVLAGDSYGDTSVWENSNVRRYLNETYLAAHFPSDELATGVLMPYGNVAFYDVVVPRVMDEVVATVYDPVDVPAEHIPPSSAGDVLIWILDVQEIQAIYNGTPDIPWNYWAGYLQRHPYSVGGPYRTRSLDPHDPSVIWSIDSDGSFYMDYVELPASVRPVTLPDSSVMLYKRGSGTQAEPYSVCYRWNVIPGVSARVGEKTITLTFPESITNNGIWPDAEAWNITDSRGTKYSVTGTTGTQNKITLTVYPAFQGNTENATLTIQYVQRFDDASQGLNNTKGAILKAVNPQNPFLHFGLPEVTLETSIGGNDSDVNGGCKCDHENSACLCESGVGNCECDYNADVCLCDPDVGNCECDHNADACLCEPGGGNCNCEQNADICLCDNGNHCNLNLSIRDGCNALHLGILVIPFLALCLSVRKATKVR